MKKFSLAPDVDITEFIKTKNSPEKNNLSYTTKTLTGSLIPSLIDTTTFNTNYYNYSTFKSLSSNVFSPIKNSKIKRLNLKRTREKYNNPGSNEFKGPWAKYKDELNFNNKEIELTNEQNDILKELEKARKEKLEKKNEKKEKKTNDNNSLLNFTPTSIFHFDQKTDYHNRSFINPPRALKNIEHSCFIPKKLIHTYTGHTKPIQKMKFFPKYGHFLFTCSLDGKVKLWDVMNNRKCLITYNGHTEGVRDISLSNDGKRFLSAGFDKIARYWDTETGKVISSIPLRKVPFCISLNPSEDKQNEFLIGTSSKSIFQYDINKEKNEEPVLEYGEHLGAVNTVTFIDYNRKFASTSDDRKILIWEYGSPVVITRISDPIMHSIPSVVLHPNGNHFLGQSLDNKIVVYDCKNGFKLNKKKKFVGHVNAGYACGLDFSPDGQFVCSGDTDGKIWFWSWRNCANYATIKAHDKICFDVKWHPLFPSLVASCSWDGTIKLWDSVKN